MEPQKTPGIFPSSYHHDEPSQANHVPVAPNTPIVPPTIPPNIPSSNVPLPRNTSDLIFGIIIGVIQIPVLYFVILRLMDLFQSPQSGYLMLLIPAVLLIEMFAFRKSRPDFLRGILLGFVILFILAFGACFLSLSSL